MNIFLTGGTGFIGKEFLLLALKSGHFVYALSRKKQKIKHKNLKWIYGSITENWSTQLKKSDILVHLASAGVNNKSITYREAFKFNVADSLFLFKNALRNNCKKWLIAGTASEYGKNCKERKKLNINMKTLPESNYAKTKCFFSKRILRLSFKTKSKCRLMRIFPVYGNSENKNRLYPSLISAAKKNKDYYINNGAKVCDFTKVEYVASTILDACNFEKKKFTSNQIWHISSGISLSVKQFATIVWKKYCAKSNLVIRSEKNKKHENYISDNKSRWKT